MADEATGARFDRRDGHAALGASQPESDGERGQVGERIVRHDYGRCVLSGGAGGANSHVSGTPDLPSAPSDVPLRVKWVTPDDPVRTSILSRPVKVRVLPLATTWPAAPIPGSILPSTQTLIQARPPFVVTTRLTPL